VCLGVTADDLPAFAYGSLPVTCAGEETNLILTLARPLSTSYTVFSVVEDVFGWDSGDTHSYPHPGVPYPAHVASPGEPAASWREAATERIRGRHVLAFVGQEVAATISTPTAMPPSESCDQSGSPLGKATSQPDKSSSFTESAMAAETPAFCDFTKRTYTSETLLDAEKVKRPMTSTPKPHQSSSPSPANSWPDETIQTDAHQASRKTPASPASVETSAGTLSEVYRASPEILKLPDALVFKTRQVRSRDLAVAGAGSTVVDVLLHVIDEGKLEMICVALSGDARVVDAVRGQVGRNSARNGVDGSCWSDLAAQETSQNRASAISVTDIASESARKENPLVKAHALRLSAWRVLREAAGAALPWDRALAQLSVGEVTEDPVRPSKGHVDGLFSRFLLDAFVSEAQSKYNVLDALFQSALDLLKRTTEYLSISDPSESPADHVTTLGTLREFVSALVRAHGENLERVAAKAKAEEQRRQLEERESRKSSRGGVKAALHRNSASNDDGSCLGDRWGNPSNSADDLAMPIPNNLMASQSCTKALIKPPLVISPDRPYGETPDEYF